MTRGLDNERMTYDGFALEHLTCFGCAHSAANIPFPSRPSGERPCGFCIRNRTRSTYDNNDDPRWYDGSPPIRNPMDCYHPLDIKDQYQAWLQEAEILGAEALNRVIDLRTRLKDDTHGRH